MKISKTQILIFKNEFIEKYLLKPSTFSQRIEFWTSKGISQTTAVNKISQCNRIFAEVKKDCISHEFTRDSIISNLHELLHRTEGRNDRLHLATLQTIAKILGYVSNKKQKLDTSNIELKVEYVSRPLDEVITTNITVNNETNNSSTTPGG